MPPPFPRGLLPGDEIDYVEDIAGLTVTATSDATAQALLTGNARTYDGATRICVEAFVVMMSATVTIIANLYDGSTDLGRLGQINGAVNLPILLQRFLTPTAGSHTFSLRLWKTSGTASATDGAGGVATYMPGYLRITRA